jgi:dihydroorotate dehydrogenase electron transfer subunit
MLKQKVIGEFEVDKLEKVGKRDFFLQVKVGKQADSVQPGQFAMVFPSSENSFDPLLGRPLGIFSAKNGKLGFLFRVYGRGTKILSQSKEKVKVLFPLGKPIPEEKGKFLFIAGGIGIAGLFLAIERFSKSGNDVVVFYGDKDISELSALKFLQNLNVDVRVFTEDGSAGTKGLPTEGIEKFKDYTWIACGPKGLLKVVQKKALSLSVNCYLLLDTRMACGIGACLGCAVKTVSGYKLCCSDGPVFRAEEVVL